MSIIGKLHEMSMYGLISAGIAFFSGKVSLSTMQQAALHPANFEDVFVCYLFWASVLFIPIAVIGAFSTKYGDGGEGLTFASSNIVVILFSHIAEELLGLISTPFWFLKDLFTRNFDRPKILDYVLYVIEIIFIVIGLVTVFKA
jgi:hypothetical protein